MAQQDDIVTVETDGVRRWQGANGQVLEGSGPGRSRRTLLAGDSPSPRLELARIVTDAPFSSLPAVVGALAEAQALALARLVTAEVERPASDAGSLLTMPEVAQRLGVTEYQAREMGRRGELPTITVGERRVRVRLGALEEWIRRRESGRTIERRGSR